MVKITFNFKKEDFDKNGNIKKSALLTYMQNAAVTDAEKYGATYDNLLAENMFFAVYRNIVKICAHVTPSDTVTLVTFQSSHDRMRFMRSYFIYISGNEPEFNGECNPYENALIYCNSIWVLMDVQKRCLLRGTDLKYPIEEYPLPFERPLKIIFENESLHKSGDFVGNQYYIDHNHHVNNASYADIVDDFSHLDSDFSYLDITYEHEILEDETVEVFSENSEGCEKLIGIRKSDGKTCFSSEIKK
jgi:acyl-ACP thioesterase